MSGPRRLVVPLAGVALALTLSAAPAPAAPVFFSTGNVDGKLALGARLPSASAVEVAAADDFVLQQPTALEGMSFTGLIPSAAMLASIQEVRVAIFRVFPNDSDIARTNGPPAFSTTQVPTRINSPSDNAAAARDSADGGLSFVASIAQSSFMATNSILNGIHPIPGQTTGGDMAVTGQETTFNVTFHPAVNLAADHYFLVPQVRLASGDFFWLSAPKPIVAPGTPFPIGFTDLPAWVRNGPLIPDWLRAGTDVVGGSGAVLNQTFSISGDTCTPMTVAPAALPAATAGTPYSAPLSASGGTAPYTFTETGALPGGVTLSPAGVLAGTPAQGGSFAIAITATDAGGCTGTLSATLTVIAPPPPTTTVATVPTPIVPTSPAPPPSGSGPTAPAISGARLSPTTFRAAGSGATLARTRRPPTGTTISYRDSVAATTTFAVLRATTGHRRGARCVAGEPHRGQKRCTRYTAAGSATHADRAGAVKLRFSGRLRGHKLTAGTYRLTLTPKGSGRTGRTVTLRFQVVR